jgi:hypothetical protein
VPTRTPILVAVSMSHPWELGRTLRWRSRSGSARRTYRGHGRQRTTTFHRGAARLGTVEIDHLNGILYADQLAPGSELTRVEKYAGGGQSRRYT